ncbi:hypothetical protein ADUPG1_000812, partial [Aduncisulcus paluster]
MNKANDWEWKEEQETAFREVIEELRTGRELVPLQEDLELILYTDASSVGVGAVLMQKDRNGIEHPILFVSKKLTATQTRWSTGEQEAYAVITAVLKCESYLRGRRFLLRTDHRNLVYIQKTPNAKLTRWRLRLEEFEFDIEHVPGKDNIIADVLSRAHCPQNLFSLDVLEEELSESFIKKIKDAQEMHMTAEEKLKWISREDGVLVNEKGEAIVPDKAKNIKQVVLQ